MRRRVSSGSGPPSTSMVAPFGASTRMASPWPIASTVMWSRPSGRVASVTLSSTATTAPRTGRGRSRRAAMAAARPGSLIGSRSGSLSSLRSAHVPSARSGNQAMAKGAGRLTSTAANGTAAAAVPSETITHSVIQAAPPASHVAASPISGTWNAASAPPTSAATALNSIATGTNGTTRTFAIGATSESRSKLTMMTGRVVSWAARVSAIGSRIHAGHVLGRRASTAPPNQMSPAVASSESWNPTSHSTGGAATQHDERRQRESRCGVGTRPAEPRDEHRAGHERGSHDRWTGPGQHHVATDRRRSHDRGRPAPTRAPAKRADRGRHQRGDDGDVPAADGDDVGEAGGRECVVDLRSDRRADPEQDSRTEGRLAARGPGRSGRRAASPGCPPAREPGRLSPGSTSAERARAIAPMPWRARYSR